MKRHTENHAASIVVTAIAVLLLIGITANVAIDTCQLKADIRSIRARIEDIELHRQPTPALSSDAIVGLIESAYQRGRLDALAELSQLKPIAPPKETPQPPTHTPPLPPAATGTAVPAAILKEEDHEQGTQRPGCRFPEARIRVRRIVCGHRLCHWLVNHPCRRFR